MICWAGFWTLSLGYKVDVTSAKLAPKSSREWFDRSANSFLNLGHLLAI